MNQLNDFFNLNLGALRLIKFTLALLLIVHVVGCMWYMVAKLDDLSPDTWVIRIGMADADNFSLYLACIYWTF